MQKRFSIVEKIREDDPSYDPIPLACENANVSPALFKFCETYIYWDGYFGPFSVNDLFDECSAEDRGLTPAEVDKCSSRDACLAILRSVAEQIEDYKEYAIVEDELGGEHEELECTITAHEIVDDLFRHVREIYGSSILSL